LEHALLSTNATAVAELLLPLRSGWVAVTVAVFAYEPEAVGVATTVTVALELLTMVPRLQMIGDVPAHVPWLGVDDTNVRPAAKVSVSVTPVAVEGPLFVTVMV